jgi:ATP-dependent Lon protease
VLIIPRKNEKDLEDLPADVKRKMKIILVDTMDDVLSVAIPGIPKKVQKTKRVAEQSTPAYPH